MKEVILIIAVLGIFVYGYFLMAKLDKFLNENRETIQKENEKEEPICVMLTEEMSEEEIVEEVRRFRDKHKSTRIVIYDSSDTELSDNLEYYVTRKP